MIFKEILHLNIKIIVMIIIMHTLDMNIEYCRNGCRYDNQQVSLEDNLGIKKTLFDRKSSQYLSYSLNSKYLAAI